MIYYIYLHLGHYNKDPPSQILVRSDIASGGVLVVAGLLVSYG